MNIKSIILLATILVGISCNHKSTPNHQINKTVNKPKEHLIIETKSIEAQITSLKSSMTDYMISAHPNYTEDDIEECVQILNEYVTEMSGSKSKEDGMQIVKNTVLKLNELNEKCEGDLIETGEREAIATIIITVGHNKGYNSEDDDITEEWREW
nr:hypothetical protein [uncultured Flavobacterium sp.]